ncbi:osmotically-inducible protein OsmY [Azonexus fungiphilus]|jgi:osmotically-inducible protein OsmY|uniref:Osmotically-inducible protein OsmY n=1 Tax=Azonexus fungiphilus TaxID=146940 RepID=A0A495WCF0_9RHOO|nr:BON domain-containing protein [Azonexus fungiphilus]NHC07036.1 BON domain-containing protein [Azonexus fungiphilus]RKT58887.1 osmotically-inducible protein OsmY [Azonexus fungiphilus]
MNKRLSLSLLLIALAVPTLQGCFPAVVAGAAVGVMSIHDRRSTGTQTDDESTEWKAAGRIPAEYKAASRVSFTSYNRRLLITGEVPNETARATIEAEARKLDGVREVYNETVIAAASSLGARSNDSFIDSKVKARLVDSNQISANHVKVVTDRGVVHLMGLVNEREARVAVSVARTTAGVKKVVNLLEVLSDDDIRRLDEQALGARKAPANQAAPVEKR